MPAPAKVVDASALAALLFGEPQAEQIADRLGQSPLIAPTLLAFEIASVCLQKLRRYPSRRDSVLAAHLLSRQMNIKAVNVNFDDVVSLAEETSLTVYDASYLWLAQTLDAELVTLDAALAKQARRRTPHP